MDTINNSTIDEKLRSLAESDYKAFNERLIPTSYEILGVRMPALKKFARELAAHPQVKEYLQSAEYIYYEHILLYGLVLAQVRGLSLDEVLEYLDRLILRFDNWAHVDTIISAFKLFGKYPEEVFAHFLPFKTHDGEFTKRVFVIVLMDYFMDSEHIDVALRHISEVKQGQYYVDMAIAWALSVGLVKHYDKTVKFLEQPVFSKFVHNKAIQKARESYRITPLQKEYLKSIKIL